MTNQIFLAYDGDDAGRLVGRAILANDAGALSEVSSRINLGHEVVKRWVQDHNGQVISGGGDEGTFSLPAEAVQDIEELRQDYEFATNLTMTVGVGQNLSEAGKSLMVGKFRGKNQVVMYDESIEQDIQAAEGRVSQGQGSDEENKISEAYLSNGGDKKAPGQAVDKNDPNKSSGDQKDFKQDSQQIDQTKKEKTGESPALTEESPQDANAKTMAEASAKVASQDPKDDSRPGDAAPQDRELPDKKGDKQKEEEIGQSNKHASGKEMSTPREKAESTGKDPSKDEFKDPMKKGEPKESVDMKTEDKPKKDVKDEKGKEAPKEAPKGGQEAAPQAQEEHSQSCPTCGKPQEEAVEVIEDNIAAPPSDEVVQQEQMNGIDNTAMPVGNEMEGNVSRPDGFSEQNVPGDTGMPGGPEGGVLSETDPGDTQDDMLGQESLQDQQIPGEEGDPDMQAVMQDGLEAGGDDAQAEQVKQMIGQALSGFKNNKQILERAQAQAPELYSSCIAMLRAMIEMAKMLGLSDGSEQMPGQAGQAPGQMPGQEEPPCPTCGKGNEEAQPKEGGFPPKKDGKAPEKKDGKEAKPEGKEDKGGFPPKKDDKQPKKDDKSAAPKEGAANESPKGSKPGAGSGLGKLPTKATTQHVARTPLAPGSINLKGQQKTIDQKTGKTRWIDRKKGVVMGPSGVPVKAGAQENN